MINNINDIEKILEENIEDLTQKFNISLIYVFGSYAKGRNTKKSDIDIAILTHGETNAYIKLNILGRLIDIFNREDIDLVILNNSNEVLRFQIIKYGKAIYADSLYSKVMFESKVMSRYMDMEHFRRIQNEYSHMRFLELMDRGDTNGISNMQKMQ